MSVTKNKTTLGVIQMRCTPQPDENFAHALDLVRSAARDGANIICLPELFRSQYFCQAEDHEYFKLAEEIPGPSTNALSAVARELNIVIVASLFEKRGPGVYHNTAAILDADGAYLGKYRKMHIPDDPLFYEKFYFTPGDLGFRAWQTKLAKIGVCICWDQWYPEAARLTALQGAETIQRSHAIANGCFVAVANRIGHEAPSGGAGIEFWGQSFIADPSGKILAKAGVDREETLIVEIDTARIDEQRTHWPFFRDRRIDAYADITRRLID
jgi:N-carbamoylputrescine amidase